MRFFLFDFDDRVDITFSFLWIFFFENRINESTMYIIFVSLLQFTDYYYSYYYYYIDAYFFVFILYTEN